MGNFRGRELLQIGGKCVEETFTNSHKFSPSKVSRCAVLLIVVCLVHFVSSYCDESVPSVPGGRGGTGRRTTVTPVYPSIPERSKPVTQLPPPRSKTIHDVHIYEPHRGR